MLHRLCASRISPFFVFAAFQVATTTACKINVTTDACSYEKLAEALAADPSCDILNVVSSKEVLAKLCAEKSFAFGKIGKKNEIWDKEYFDGGTAWNEHREYLDESGIVEDKSKLATYPGTHIKDIRDNVANSRVITFPDYIDNFENCELRAAMCCFVQDRQANDNNGNCAKPYDTNCADADPGDNTDVCYVDMARAPTSSHTKKGYAVFEEEDEGPTHCHGIAWATDPTDNSAKYKGNNLFYFSMYDHLTQRGYARNVPGAPMCGCVEKMPVVSRSDCTEIDATESVTFEYPNKQGGLSVTINSIDIEFNACQGVKDDGDAMNNDLEGYYRRLVREEKASLVELWNLQSVSLVGNNQCHVSITNFFRSKGLVQASTWA